jgi:hypothetical protein
LSRKSQKKNLELEKEEERAEYLLSSKHFPPSRGFEALDAEVRQLANMARVIQVMITTSKWRGVTSTSDTYEDDMCDSNDDHNFF